MSEIKVSKLTNRAGTGAPDLSQGVKISGTASTLLAPTRTESATEPTSPYNGDTWYDTDNDTYDVYINDEWKRFIGEGGGAVSWTVDVSDISYDSVSFSVSSQDVGSGSIAFNSDGTKMYMVGNANDTIYQYSLSTGFDLSTASYDSVTFSVSQDTSPQDVTFNSDGTKMYVIGATSDTAYQYSLSTAFDLSTASYDSVSFSVSSQEATARCLVFNSDGTKMYVVGSSNDTVYQYSLSTGFDLSTASYDSVSFSINSQVPNPRSIAFNPDGTKMYAIGAGNDTLYQYSLSTGFDVSTASYDSLSFDVSSQDHNPGAMIFNSDGTKAYMIGGTNDTVYQYSTGL